LRKYKHIPATVLNPDGTPNPYPVIDVYGTRRGPKQRPRNTVKSTSKENNDIPLPSHAPLPLPLFQPSYGVISQQSGKLTLPYPYGCIMPNTFSANKNGNNNHNHNSLLPAFPQNNSKNTEDKDSDAVESRRNLSDENYDHFHVATSQYCHMNKNSINNNSNSVSDSNALKDTVPEKSLQKQNSDDTNRLTTGEHVHFLNRTVDGDPLDLSKHDAMNITSEASATASVLQKSTSMKASKHRRKGQAYKLDHISRKLQQTSFSDNKGQNRNYSVSESEDKSLSLDRTDYLISTGPTDIASEEDTQHKQQQESELRKVNDDLPKGKVENKSTLEKNSAAGNSLEVYHCSHCDITFNDIVLYSMHRGYHGYQDPFKCNMCGVQTADKVEFFLHIARSSHS
jgi:hunchback-like protein